LFVALDPGSVFSTFGTVPKWIIVILPFAGSTASTILVQSKVFIRFHFREKGRLDIHTLIAEGRGKFAAGCGAWANIELRRLMPSENFRLGWEIRVADSPTLNFKT